MKHFRLVALSFFAFIASSLAQQPVFLETVSTSGEVLKSLPLELEKQYLCYQKMLEAPMPRFHAEDGVVSFEGMVSRCTNAPFIQPRLFAPGSEVKTLVLQGPPQNRIDLTIVGDGYTPSEKELFFAHANQVVHDLFGNETFATYLPLFNVHAVFVPSNQSGIGDGRPKDTALKLYRHPTVRQAVMPGNPSAASAAARLAPDTDYPILLANDPYYGGLGGEFAITTAAPFNITTVLRHELGHNFGDVGEEYDGGQVYRGANFSRGQNVSWPHWIEGAAPAWAAPLLHYSAPWQNLNGGVLNVLFNFSEGAALFIDFSSLGFDTPADVELQLDGQTVPYSGNFNYDRNFYRVAVQAPPSGRHQVSFIDKSNDRNNIVSKVGLYALPQGFPLDSPAVGRFGTYSEGGFVGYRPTESFCLMRNMRSTRFCPVCLENMWDKLLSRLNLIDDLQATTSGVKLSVIPLANRLAIRWAQNGTERPDLANRVEWQPSANDRGKWTVEVFFLSPEVRIQNPPWARSQKTFNL